MDTTVWFCYTSYTLHNNFIHFAYKVSLFCHTLPHAPRTASGNVILVYNRGTYIAVVPRKKGTKKGTKSCCRESLVNEE